MKKYLHFYFNKYLLIGRKKKYFISISFKHKALWYRVAKVGTRTIKNHLEEDHTNFIYSSEASYFPPLYKNYFKFAFVRDPTDRFISCWKNKVIERNYFNFSESDYEEMKNLDYFIAWVENQDISSCDEHLREQSALIDLKNVDFIGRFENFETDLIYVLKKLNISTDKIVHKNKTKDRVVQLSETQKKKLKKIYKNDYKNFYSTNENNAI